MWIFWTFASAVSVLVVLFWVIVFVGGLWRLSKWPSIGEYPLREPDSWPRVSILVAAHNEGKYVADSLRSMCRQDYPDFEILAVDDRSSDRTGEFLDDLADREERLRVFHVETVPEGWLGKVNALNTALQGASGEWLLLADADVELKSGALRRTMGAALGTEADHVSFLPHFRSVGFWFDAMLTAFTLIVLSSQDVEDIHDPEHPAFAGLGAFNLVRRKTFERAGGFEALRLEIVDDVGVGYLISQVGGTTRVGFAPDWIELTWYDSALDFMRGLEKNTFTVLGDLRFGRILGLIAFQLLVYGGLVLGLLSPFAPVFWSSLGTCALLPLTGLGVALLAGRPWLPALFWNLGHALLFIVMVRSTWDVWRRGGITWGGKFYALEELRAHQKVRF